jgi:voltage-gated potassium channel Kch
LPRAQLRVTAAFLSPAHAAQPSAQVFSKPSRPTPRQIERALQPTCDASGWSIPGVHTPIHPASLAVRAWTAWMLVLTLTYVAFVMPICIAFDTTMTNSHVTAVIDLVAGACFLADICVNFRCGMYYVCEGHVKLVLDGRVIAEEYVRNGLLLDALAAVPFVCQLVYYAAIAATGSPPASHAFVVAMMRVFRLLRVVRLWKLIRSRRAMLGMEIFVVHQMGTPLVVFAASTVYWFSFMVNIMACVWVFTATLEDFCNSWVVQLAAPPAEDLPAQALRHLETCGGALGEGLALPSGRDVYITALYFATMTLTTVGYGDVVAKTQWEKGVAISFMLVGAFFIATFTGQMVAVLQKHGAAQAAELAFKDKMVEADRFVKDNGLPPAVQRQVLRWVQHAYMPHEARFSWRGELLAELPIPVRASAVSYMVGEAALREALRGASPDTAAWVAGRMEPRALHTGHFLCLAGEDATELYVSASGSLLVLAPGGRTAAVLPGRGHVLGGDAAAAALAAADGGDAAAPAWELSVQAAVESNIFALPHAALRAALRMGAAAALPPRPPAEEAAAVGASLARVCAMGRAARAL